MAEKKDVDDYEKAAQAIWDADFLLIVAGPCFYEDSSKTVFADERCDPMLIQTNPEKFFGFWGQFFNRYNDRQPHDGYQILRRWRDNYFDVYGQDMRKRQAPAGRQKEEEGEGAAQAVQRCYVLTSTVDGSFVKSGFRDDEVFAISGDINQWQCWIPCNKTLVWTIPDSKFRFEVDTKLGLAKPVKWVDDVRPDQVEEKFVVYDSDEEPYDTNFPPIQPKTGDKPLSEHEKAKQTRLKNERMMKRLNRGTVIPVSPEHQESHPDLPAYHDWFMPTPTSNRMRAETYTFLLEKKRQSDADGTDAEDYTNTNEGLEQPINYDLPEQPYILRPRINHSLAHVLGLYYNKYPFHEGVLEEVDPKEERTHRLQRWNEQQKFFDPSVPEVSNARKRHIAYHISVFIQDAAKPQAAPPLQAPAPVRTPDMIIDEAFEGEDVGLSAASLPFLQQTSLLLSSRLSQSGGRAASVSPFGPQISLTGTPLAEMTARQALLGQGESVLKDMGTILPLPTTSRGSRLGIASPNTAGRLSSRGDNNTTAGAGDATITPRSKMGNETNRTRTPSVAFETPSMIGEMPEVTYYDQGSEGKFFFSYVPIVKTHQDPDNILYDTIHIDFPFNEDAEDLPLRGRISVVVECCVLPEPVKVVNEEGGDKKKKKKEEKSQAGVKLDPILEPSQYASFQLVGKVSTMRKGKSTGASSVMSGLMGSSGDGGGGGAGGASGGAGAGGGGGRHGKAEEAEEKEDFEYRLHTRKGHVLRVGSTQTARRSIKYLEIECPVMDPTKADYLHFGVTRKPMDDAPAAKAAAGLSIFGARAAAKEAEHLPNKKASKKKKQRPVPNHQCCPNCHDLARPNVIMDPKKDIRAVVPPGKKPYGAWEQAMMKALKFGGGGIVILELGCEKKLDPARKNSERIYKMAKNTQKATHVRISAEDLNTKGKKGGFGSESDKVVTIVDNVLNALNHIDKCMADMKRRK